MSSNRLFSRVCVFASLLAFGFTATTSYGQTSALSVPRVLGPVNESQLATLKKVFCRWPSRASIRVQCQTAHRPATC